MGIRMRRRLTAFMLSVPLAVTTLTGVGLTSCIAIAPKPGSFSQERRLEAFPTAGLNLRDDVEILWDAHSIPSIHADNHEDVPYAIGLVHAHLRLGQMELLRRVSQGRLSEVAGPFVNGIDAMIRTIDLDRAVPEMMTTLPEETRIWLERYVEGLNDYQRLSTRRSADFRSLGISTTPWTVEEVLIFGRLVSADINWGRWLALLPKRDLKGYEEFIARLEAFHDDGVPSFGPGEPTPLSLLSDVSKSGSNCFVLAGDRSESGSALLAADPHLGLPQPNSWCIVSYRSPEGAVSGLTIPLLPFVLIGRNETIAWGGTNMQNMASTLYSVEGEELSERTEKIRTRLWFDKEAKIRESERGPVVTDAALFKRLDLGDAALVWNGHQVSDESSAFLRVAQASTFDEFREAFSTYGAGGQNFLYADSSGNIGQLLATRFHPAAGRIGLNLPADPEDPDLAWGSGIPSDELPAAFNPPEGHLVSANNTPIITDPPMLIQGNANDRLVRMQQVLDGMSAATLDDLAELQRDVFSAASLETVKSLLSVVSADDLTGTAQQVYNRLVAWDGYYTRESQGALGYQAWLREIIDSLYAERFDEELLSTLRSAPYVHDFVRQDIDEGTFSSAQLAGALTRAAKKINLNLAWGNVHRYRAQHPLGMVPLLGRSYRVGDFASPGTLTTVAKAAHPATGQVHGVTFGANARYVTDLSDLDANQVVLLGGQDGFMGSEHFVDQIPLWFEPRMIPLPLSEQGQRGRAIHTTELSPQ